MQTEERRDCLLRGNGKDGFTEDIELGELNQHDRFDKTSYSLRGRMMTWQKTVRMLRLVLFFLLPSPVQVMIHKDINIKEKSLRPTAFLDGMRGLACLFVYIFHISHSCHQVFTGTMTFCIICFYCLLLIAYASDSEYPEAEREFLKLPLIRVIYSGSGMVAIYFVVSGYALSYRSVQLMRAGKYNNFFRNLSSAAFRRGIRLYLPCVASSLMIALSVHAGSYDWTREIAHDSSRLTFVHEPHQKRFPTLHEQLGDWFDQMLRFLNPWSMDAGTNAADIDVHLWTIPFEYRSSIILFVTQLALGRLRTVPRNIFLLSCIAWSFYNNRRVVQLFYWGFFLAELDFARKAAAEVVVAFDTPILDAVPKRTESLRPYAWKVFYTIAFLASLYLVGQPQWHINKSPGWITLSKLIPKGQEVHTYWTNWGAVLLVWTASCAPFLQRIFTARFSQYMGYISFGFYLIHGPMTHTIGYATMDYMWRTIGMDPWSVKEVGFGIACLVTFGMTMWAADVFTRVVDGPTIKFARWLETKCLNVE